MESQSKHLWGKMRVLVGLRSSVGRRIAATEADAPSNPEAAAAAVGEGGDSKLEAVRERVRKLAREVSQRALFRMIVGVDGTEASTLAFKAALVCFFPPPLVGFVRNSLPPASFLGSLAPSSGFVPRWLPPELPLNVHTPSGETSGLL